MREAAELMQVALGEAARALGRTRPNPVVGCVIAKGGEIIAAGHHVKAGAPHAEAVALARAGAAAAGADVYVTLEPCDHWGRTPPCSEALIAAKVRRVFIGMRDPNPVVNGRGLKRLRRAGIKTEVGLLEQDCAALNEAYIRYVRDRRPLFVAKAAMTLDGKVATRTGDARWISGKAARDRGHALRNVCDAILVGRGTVSADDPRLTCRVPGGRDPVRIVLDTEARTPTTANVVRAARRSTAPTWIIVGPDARPAKRRGLEAAGAEVLECPERRGRIDLKRLAHLLYEREITSVLVEGGPTVLGSLLDLDLVDKLHLFVAPMILGDRRARSVIAGEGTARLAHAWRLHTVTYRMVGADLEIVGYPHRR
ncbi:MAG: bifunctional diaminohydroxyphosphoribosylaminopyrimidine deaminase/5-amino-6-(5-phosphoribosylamino)uracil reductase RibD [Deltaproteobacteria bacterium]|nr:bifunctional diaminohydroxyphosphoribosylaminopyrimidine deaminase/5-amino-6-(5-phosphoribosylamino)uracil reductase RibD [Deltaproteobacteria bacterium]